MEFKKVIIILSVTIIMVFGIMFGVSYGWYAYKNAESSIFGSTIKITPTTIFSQTEYISSNNTMPIFDEDRYNYGNKNSFTVTLNEDLKEYEVGIEISLIDIKMDDELKISNYKYELLQDKVIISSGNFENLNKSSTLKILPMTILNHEEYPKTYTYELYIWLSETDEDQNYLMDKGFSAKINVNTAAKK